MGDSLSYLDNLLSNVNIMILCYIRCINRSLRE